MICFFFVAGTEHRAEMLGELIYLFSFCRMMGSLQNIIHVLSSYCPTPHSEMRHKITQCVPGVDSVGFVLTACSSLI